MNDSAFERIVARLVKELLNENEIRNVFETELRNAESIGDKSKMNQILRESEFYARRINFVKSLLEELNK